MDSELEGALGEKIKAIIEDISKKGKLAVAFSGGVDSSVLAALAHKALRDNAIAITVKSPLLPSGQLEEAKRVAREIGIKHVILELNELNIPGFSENPRHRCYLCKKYRYGMLKNFVRSLGIDVIADGTNVSDLKEYRPGLRALEEEGIYTPFLKFCVRKEEIRKIARALGLSVAGSPPTTCLATRFPYGEKLTVERLRRVDEAEAFIKRLLGIRLVRVRCHGDLARIEVDRRERSVFFDEKILDLVAEKLRALGFKFVCLDMMGYRPGSFDENTSVQSPLKDL